MSQADIEAMFEKLLHPPPMDEGFGGEERTQCHIRESVMQSIEYALHCAICIAVLSGIVLYTPADALRIVASTPFLLPIAGIMATGPTLGIGILKSVVILWALVIGVVVVSVATLPFHCSPIAQAVAFFFLMWLSRYWLSYFGAPSNMKFVSAIHLLGALSSIQLSSAAGTCDYSTWPLLLVALISFAISTTVAFLSSFLPWPRFSFMDAAHLNRRVMRDSVRLVKASLSVLLLAHQRPEDDDGDCSDSNCQHAKVDKAEAHYVQLMEHLLAHMDSDLSTLASIQMGVVMECGGCCCRGPKQSVLSPAESKATQAISAVAYAVSRSVMGHRESDAISFQGHQLSNFGAHSGFLYFKLLQRRRARQQRAVNAQAKLGPGFIRITPKGRNSANLTLSGSTEMNDSSPTAETNEVDMDSTETKLFKELTKVATPGVLQIIEFLDSPEVQQMLHKGYLLTPSQSATIKELFDEMLTAVSLRRRELMFPAVDDVTVDDFDVLGYLGLGKLLFSIQTFVKRISSRPIPTAMPGPTPGQMFCFVLCAAGCGTCGVAGGSPAQKKATLCGCGPKNIMYLKQSFSSSLAISVAALLFIVPAIMGLDTSGNVTSGTNSSIDARYDSILYNSLWAPLTVVFISDANIGASFQMSILRFFGTVTGALFGSFVEIFIGNSPPYTIVALTLWTFVCCLLQNNKRYGYAAQVCAFTAAIIVFGDVNVDAASFDISRYTLSRMSQTFIGVAVYIVCASLIFPVSARRSAIGLLREIFEKLASHHESAYELQRRTVYPAPEEDTPEFKKETQLIFVARSRERDAIRRDIDAHEALTQQAAAEFSCSGPDFYPEYPVAM
eukprot:INCI12870.2.p1 GENE.INCI12870.2~~INCI12870.2.p1  ORF type:complete len:937 (+),score=159.47 INCI12870.2:291-2813(+)